VTIELVNLIFWDDLPKSFKRQLMPAAKGKRSSEIVADGLLARAAHSERGILELLSCSLRFQIKKNNQKTKVLLKSGLRPGQGSRPSIWNSRPVGHRIASSTSRAFTSMKTGVPNYGCGTPFFAEKEANLPWRRLESPTSSGPRQLLVLRLLRR